MREIKLRAWNGKQMAYFEPFDQVWDNEANTSLVAVTEDEYERGLGDALMQYTGLKDIKGVDIYEGDIVENELGIFRVVFSVKLAGWYIEKLDGWREFLFSGLGNKHTDEVIGNVYENSELLK